MSMMQGKITTRNQEYRKASWVTMEALLDEKD
jgi:hypothetical protein